MRNKFWKWTKNEKGKRVLRLDGVIDDWKFSDDDSLSTPKEFREELNAGTGDIELYINSPGGNIFAAAEIYSMLKEYDGGHIVAKVPAFAASAATVVMCASDIVEIGELAMLCIHDPFVEVFCGNEKDLEQGIEFLRELKENIINIYRQKTGLARDKISELMDAETYINSKKALELHFADQLMGGDTQEDLSPQIYSIKPNINLLFRAYQQSKNKVQSVVKNPYKRIALGSDYDLLRIAKGEQF